MFETSTQRALFQRDLLAVDGWLASRESADDQNRTILRTLLTQAIHKVALDDRLIANLPDNYENAIAKGTARTAANLAKDFELPHDLLDPKGSWVCLGEDGGTPVARTHIEYYGGRSTFNVFLRIPGGRSATEAFLKSLRAEHSISSLGQATTSELTMPPGAALALVRQLVLVDRLGGRVVSRLVESVQVRMYTVPHLIEPKFLSVLSSDARQEFSAVELRRGLLFAGIDGGLHKVTKGEGGHSTFILHSRDPFELNVSEKGLIQPNVYFGSSILSTCDSCHGGAGLSSFLSYSRDRFNDSRDVPTRLIASHPERESTLQLSWRGRGR